MCKTYEELYERTAFIRERLAKQEWADWEFPQIDRAKIIREINERMTRYANMKDFSERSMKMEAYKERMKEEYKELKGKYERLHKLLVRFDSKTLDFTLNCPIELLRKQSALMGDYLYVLEMRGFIEDIDLYEDDK